MSRGRPKGSRGPTTTDARTITGRLRAAHVGDVLWFDCPPKAIDTEARRLHMQVTARQWIAVFPPDVRACRVARIEVLTAVPTTTEGI
jgi:hypothetical protein